MLLNLAYGMLILLCAASICGLVFFTNLTKKLFALAISYTSILVLIFVILASSSSLGNLISLLTSLLILFSINLIIGAGMLRRLEKKELEK